MFTQLFRDWWLIAARGALAIIFGILALFWREPTELVLVLLFGVFSIVDGIFAIAAGTASRGYFKRWWALLLEGITGIVMGVLIFYWPDVTALVLLYFIAARAVATGFLRPCLQSSSGKFSRGNEPGTFFGSFSAWSSVAACVRKLQA
jgi:uncharacterized membrane protein HdeD (DUF308 family)